MELRASYDSILLLPVIALVMALLLSYCFFVFGFGYQFFLLWVCSVSIMPNTPMNLGPFFFYISSCWSFGSGWECLHLGFSFCSFLSISLATPHSQNISPFSNLWPSVWFIRVISQVLFMERPLPTFSFSTIYGLDLILNLVNLCV